MWDRVGVALGVLRVRVSSAVGISTLSFINSAASGKFTQIICASVSTAVKQEYNNVESTDTDYNHIELL